MTTVKRETRLSLNVHVMTTDDDVIYEVCIKVVCADTAMLVQTLNKHSTHFGVCSSRFLSAVM